MSSGKEQVASVRNYLLQLSSLDALDLPTEIEGVFCLATKRHKKTHNCCCGKRVKFHQKSHRFDGNCIRYRRRSARTNSRRNQWLHEGSAGREWAGCDGPALRARSELQSRDCD